MLPSLQAKKKPIQVIQTPKAGPPVGPYSQAIKSDSLVFVSGQIPIDPKTGEMINGSLTEQTRQILANIGSILETADSGLSKIVKISVFLINIEDFEEVNSVFAEVFAVEPPARETVEVSRLPKEANIEISCIAVADK